MQTADDAARDEFITAYIVPQERVTRPGSARIAPGSQRIQA